MPFAEYPAWWNGNDCQVADLRVSILDLGLIHSDATYDVVAIRNHDACELDQHLDRFIDSCKAWRLPLSYDRTQLSASIMSVHQRTGQKDSLIWTSATRGVPMHGNPRDLLSPRINVMIYAKPWQKFNGTNHATVMEARSVLRVPDVCINQTKNKNFAWYDLTMAQWEAIDNGFDTAVVFGVDGFLSEGPGFNIGIIKDGKILTPARNRLSGISMKKIQQICLDLDMPFIWKDLTRDEVDSCDDMFLSTTVGNIVTVTNYNGRPLETSPTQDALIMHFENLEKVIK